MCIDDRVLVAKLDPVPVIFRNLLGLGAGTKVRCPEPEGAPSPLVQCPLIPGLLSSVFQVHPRDSVNVSPTEDGRGCRWWLGQLVISRQLDLRQCEAFIWVSPSPFSSA